MKIKGKIVKLFFSNDTKAFGVLDATEIQESPEARPKRVSDSIRFNAAIYKAAEGMFVEMEGDFADTKYGKQFIATSATASMDNAEAIRGILVSGFIKGVGPAIADNIIKAFGNDTKNVIETKWEKLAEVPGISKKKAEIIHKCFKESRHFVELISFFNGQITDRQVTVIYEAYKSNAVKILKEDPYRLIELDGFGFKKVDAIAQKAGIPKDSPKRAKAAIVFTLKSLSENGDCYCHIDSLNAKVKELVSDITIDDNDMADLVMALIKEGRVVLDGDVKLYLKSLYESEVFCAKFIKKLSATKPQYYKSHLVEMALNKTEAALKFELEGKQRRAVHESLKNNFSVITGGPGTGKTTVVNALIDGFRMCGGKNENIYLLAPTGRASRRMKEATGLNATTIHSFKRRLDVAESFDKCTNNNVQFIIDESSMIDINVAKMLFACIKRIAEYAKNVSVTMIGDTDQLPPIGPGNIFRDLVQSSKIVTTMLEFSHRFGGAIASNAINVKRGYGLKTFVCDDTFVVQPVDKANSGEAVINAYLEAIEHYPQKDVQIIVPMRTRSHTAANDLNEIIRDRVNPDTDGTQKSIEVGTKKFRVKDRVMQTSNRTDKDVYNGDCGSITDIYKDCKGNEIVIVTFDDGRVVDYGVNDLTDLTLSYAITIHKSQGSEYKVVITSFTKEHYIMLQRNLLYTAFTRAKSKLIVFCEKEAINMAVRNNPAINRCTDFQKRLI